jgi:hypothetical protein
MKHKPDLGTLRKLLAMSDWIRQGHYIILIN